MTITSQHSPRELCFDIKLLDASGKVLYADSTTNPSGPTGTITTRFGTGPVSRPYIQYAVPAGTYYVMIRGAGSPMSHQDFTVTIDDTIYENENGNGDKPSNDFNYPDVPDESSSDQAGVGGLPMSFNGAAMGGAALSVPIDVPKGVGGLQPRRQRRGGLRL